MRATFRTGFGGPEVLVIPGILEPAPEKYVAIEVKAFGLNHAELHMRKGEWDENPKRRERFCAIWLVSCNPVMRYYLEWTW